MAKRSLTIEQALSLWWKTGQKPTEDQIKRTFELFREKLIDIKIEEVAGLAEALAGKQDLTDFENILNEYYSKTEIDNFLSEKEDVVEAEDPLAIYYEAKETE